MFNRKIPNYYKEILERRRQYKYSFQDNKFIIDIEKNTVKDNVDNVARTKAYADFYEVNKEIKWSFLASMVSRNAGWNMTDLQNKWFKLALNRGQRNNFFSALERANWIIFHDAYPQL